VMNPPLSTRRRGTCSRNPGTGTPTDQVSSLNRSFQPSSLTTP
jgi:hypothetical protein